MINQDTRELARLSWFCSYNTQISQYFAEQNETRARQLGYPLYDRLVEEFRANHAGSYITRLIVFREDGRRILQVGNYPAGSIPVDRFSLTMLNAGNEPYNVWSFTDADCFLRIQDKQ
jgi:hypothetical protein